MGFLKSSDEILGVGEFTRRFRALVKLQIPELWLRGEISNIKPYSSGHTYFTIKDADASISAVLFKGYSRGISLELRDGMRILAFGEIGVYEVKGTYQMVVKAILPDGVGDLAARFELLKKKLSDEGLFDVGRKKPIPQTPRRVAVITSPTGAAVRDFLKILRRRAWKGEVYVLPSRVQGEGSAGEVVDKIRFAQDYVFEDGGSFDLLVITRGGGSIEDLWTFNEECVARAVASCSIPTISAVGHEIDFTLCDFAADLRAETPSAAAELISSSAIELRERLLRNEADLRNSAFCILDNLRRKLESYSNMLSLHAPDGKINSMRIMLDELESRIDLSVHKNVSHLKSKISDFLLNLSKYSPANKIGSYREYLLSMEKQLEILNPENTLKRGFAMAFDKAGKRIVSAKSASSNKSLLLRFRDGEVGARVGETS